MTCSGLRGVRGPGIPEVQGLGFWLQSLGLDSGVSECLRAWKSTEVGGFSPPLSVESGVFESLRAWDPGSRARDPGSGAEIPGSLTPGSSEVGGFSPPLSV